MFEIGPNLTSLLQMAVAAGGWIVVMWLFAKYY